MVQALRREAKFTDPEPKLLTPQISLKDHTPGSFEYLIQTPYTVKEDTFNSTYIISLHKVAFDTPPLYRYKVKEIYPTSPVFPMLVKEMYDVLWTISDYLIQSIQESK